MEPITPYSEKFDFRTEHGRKIYEACTKSLSVTFDGTGGKHHSFLTSLKNVSDERSWREIYMIPVGNPPINYDLLTTWKNQVARFANSLCENLVRYLSRLDAATNQNQHDRCLLDQFGISHHFSAIGQ
jgi:hypothetical protein